MTTDVEQLEQLRVGSERTRHDTLPPVLGMRIADELQRASASGNTTAGRMFARRRERSDKFVVPETNVRQLTQRRPETIQPTPKPPPQPLKPEVAMRRSTSQPVVCRQPMPTTRPVPRLKEMIEMPRAAMSPWEAAAQYGGRVDPAFEHLPAFRRASQQVEWVDEDCAEDGTVNGGNEDDVVVMATDRRSMQYPQTDDELDWIDRQVIDRQVRIIDQRYRFTIESR